MEWEFDKNGFVKPYTRIPITINEFKEKFTGEKALERRYEIFEQYQIFISKLKAFIGTISFYQWVNGSFIRINSFPNDLDIVTFLPEQVFESKYKNLKDLIFDKQLFLLDLYFVKVFPSDHKNFFIYQSDRMYWLRLFS